MKKLSAFAKAAIAVVLLSVLALTIGITVGNALNVYISSKSRSIWPGLFTAVLWGVWTLCSAGGLTNSMIF